MSEKTIVELSCSHVYLNTLGFCVACGQHVPASSSSSAEPPTVDATECVKRYLPREPARLKPAVREDVTDAVDGLTTGFRVFDTVAALCQSLAAKDAEIARMRSAIGGVDGGQFSPEIVEAVVAYRWHRHVLLVLPQTAGRPLTPRNGEDDGEEEDNALESEDGCRVFRYRRRP